MDFKQLKSFVTVVEYKSFSRAADKLHIAQPTISTHIRQLEEELGSHLILRTTKSIEITAQGWDAYRYASKILDLKDCIMDNCSSNARSIVRIGASTIPATYILPNMLANFAELSSETYFNVSQTNSQAVIEGLLDGRFDLGLVGNAGKQDGVIF